MMRKNMKIFVLLRIHQTKIYGFKTHLKYNFNQVDFSKLKNKKSLQLIIFVLVKIVEVFINQFMILHLKLLLVLFTMTLPSKKFKRQLILLVISTKILNVENYFRQLTMQKVMTKSIKIILIKQAKIVKSLYIQLKLN